MTTQTETKTTEPQTTRRPGIYRGLSPAEFGLWRLRRDGVWLFCLPVAGEMWKVAADQSGEGLTPLVNETGN